MSNFLCSTTYFSEENCSFELYGWRLGKVKEAIYTLHHTLWSTCAAGVMPFPKHFPLKTLISNKSRLLGRFFFLIFEAENFYILFYFVVVCSVRVLKETEMYTEQFFDDDHTSGFATWKKWKISFLKVYFLFPFSNHHVWWSSLGNFFLLATLPTQNAVEKTVFQQTSSAFFNSHHSFSTFRHVFTVIIIRMCAWSARKFWWWNL